MVILDHQQSHIGRPRQLEDGGKFVQPPRTPGHQQGAPLQRRRRRFARHCLANWPGQEKRSHLLQVRATEPAPELRSQVSRQPFDQLLAIPRTPLSLLLGLHDAPTNLPIAGRHQRIDAACRRAARSIEHFHDAAVNAGIAGRGFPRRRKRLSVHATASWGCRAPVMACRRLATSSAASRTGLSSV